MASIWAAYFAKKALYLIIFKGFTIFQENWEGPQPGILAIAYSPRGPLLLMCCIMCTCLSDDWNSCNINLNLCDWLLIPFPSSDLPSLV